MDSEGIELTERGGGASATGTGDGKGRWKSMSKAGTRTKQFLTDETNDRQTRDLMKRRQMAAINKFNGGKSQASEGGDAPDGNCIILI